MLKIFFTTLMLAFTVGCASRQSYEITLHNETTKPVTLWLTKDGGEIEEGWVSPEQLLASDHGDELTYDMQSVPPGKTGFTENISGHFEPANHAHPPVHAVLRVYRGELSLDDILSDVKSQLPRTDYRLTPGKNDLAVTDESGKLIVAPTSDPEMLK
jgi:hypothetical protein